MTRCPGFVSLAVCLDLAGCSTASEKNTSAPATPATVNGERITAADSEPGQWMTHGRTDDEQRFSPLARLKTDNVKDLRLCGRSASKKGHEERGFLVPLWMRSAAYWRGCAF